MILRKPYAFLIKHFRMIHLIIVSFVLFVLYKSWGILGFLGDYISAGKLTETYRDISGMYVGTVLTVVVSLIVIISAVILYLMKHKKKPSLFYVFMVINYSALLILLLYTSSFIYDLQFTTPDIRFTKIIRDVYLVEMIIQVLSLIISFVRTIGFDIKKFDFKKDIMELDVSDDDNAEFEFDLGLDTEEMKVSARKKLRFFKYYYKENKIIFLGLFSVISIVAVVFVTKAILSIEKVYSEKETFETRLLEISVLDSYKTTKDYKNNKINDKYFYIILNVRYKNKSASDVQINLDNARVNYKEYYSIPPTKLIYNKFPEFGVPYFSQIIHAGETRDFMLVYEVEKESYNEDFRMKYLYNIEVVNNKIEYKYRTVKLSLDEFGEIEEKDTKKLGEELTLSDSLLKNTKITINDIELSNNFTYNIVKCRNNTCNKTINFLTPSTDKVYEMTLMKVNYKILYDEMMGKGYSVSEFIAKFGSIRFVINGKEYNSKIDISDVTPFPTNDYAFLEVRAKLSMAEKIYLDFTIRDKKYTYIIKDENVKEESNDLSENK